MRLPEPAEEDAQHRVGVGGGADGGAGVGAHPLLVDDDRRRQPFEYVDLRPRQRRHEALHEGAVGLVDQPLRLRGDRAEHQRALARAGDAGEHRQPALRDLDADVLEVVHARALHADQVVAVGNVQRRRLRVRPRGHAHRVSISSRCSSASMRAKPPLRSFLDAVLHGGVALLGRLEAHRLRQLCPVAEILELERLQVVLERLHEPLGRRRPRGTRPRRRRRRCGSGRCRRDGRPSPRRPCRRPTIPGSASGRSRRRRRARAVRRRSARRGSRARSGW